ncbi:acyl-CoA thioesterase [Bacillus massiliigorillae]|uniref:acyl-CoA thioesterase n=1 Tax=Bacillus massiliigorillae TaxID=1243664 RepID=UPI0003AA9C08|nr:thioesterase family protein [Bacillus massiliigorillae]
MLISKKEIEVRYAETDQMGVVYHANYIVWLELGRTQIVKDLGFNYSELEELGYVSPVLEVHVSYKKSLKYGETATVHTWIEEYSPTRTTYGYEIYNEKGELAVTATTLNIVVKKETFRPISMKRYFPEWHEVYEKNKKQK